jgi:hypothetical protein
MKNGQFNDYQYREGLEENQEKIVGQRKIKTQHKSQVIRRAYQYQMSDYNKKPPVLQENRIFDNIHNKIIIYQNTALAIGKIPSAVGSPNVNLINAGRPLFLPP